MFNFFTSLLLRNRLLDRGDREDTQNSTQVAVLFEDWSSFSLEKKADLLMAEGLMQALNITRREAVIRLTGNKQNLIKLLDKQGSKDLATVWDSFFPSQQRQISIACAIKKIIVANPAKNYSEIAEQAVSLFQQEFTPPVFLEEVRLYQLREILNSWVDWKKAQQQAWGPLACLQVVLAHYEHPFPIDFFSQAFDRDRFPHIRFLDEAALLFNQLHHTDMFDNLENNGRFSIHLLEDRYLSMLAEDWQKQKILDQLFEKTNIGNDTQAIYFNGLAFKQAVGKSFADLINSPELEKNSAYRKLSVVQRTQLLKEKFNQIGESTQYNIGSLEHSLASVTMRIIYYQYSRVREPFNDLEEMLLLFKFIE